MKLKFQPGDQILFDANGIWNGQLILDGTKNGEGSASEPIVIGSYHQGDVRKKQSLMVWEQLRIKVHTITVI